MISINDIDVNEYEYIFEEDSDFLENTDELMKMWNVLTIEERSKYFLAEKTKVIPSDYRSGTDIAEDVIVRMSDDLGIEYEYIENHCDKKKLQQLEKALNNVFGGAVLTYEKGEQINPNIKYKKRGE